ncbi:response regulator [Nocardioides mesophilus]|nr:response regulator transcription factor [Nocardioides mesophilus]
MRGQGRRVLLVEDDARIRRVLAIALRDEGYRVVEADTGEGALERHAESPVDVVILDLMLPGLDGFEVSRRMRRTSDVPIIVVSALGDSHDIVAGLEAGADDYMTKPVVAKELSARIRALLRRSRSSQQQLPTIVVGSLEIRPREGVVLRDGHPVALTTTELRLVERLAGRVGEPVSRETLLTEIWGYDYFGDNRLVDVHISRLRSKIEPDPGNPRHVVTVRGLGYKLAP